MLEPKLFNPMTVLVALSWTEGLWSGKQKDCSWVNQLKVHFCCLPKKPFRNPLNLQPKVNRRGAHPQTACNLLRHIKSARFSAILLFTLPPLPSPTPKIALSVWSAINLSFYPQSSLVRKFLCTTDYNYHLHFPHAFILNLYLVLMS